MRQIPASSCTREEPYMPKPKTPTGEKNLISKRLIALREQNHMSQRALAFQLQLHGYDMDKNESKRINDTLLMSKSKHSPKFSTFLMNI